MYDAVEAKHIPQGAGMVAGYVDGAFRWSEADWAMHPAAVKVRIAVFANTDDGQVLDVERWDSTPLEAPGWATMRRRQGNIPSIYCSASSWPDVAAAFARAGVAEPCYWIAAHPGDPGIPTGAIAHQYADTGLVDLSLVRDYWPGVDPEPPPTDQKPRPHMPKTALPPGASPIRDHHEVWKPDGSRLDVFVLAGDGHLYQYWWATAPGEWSGPVLIDGPG
jgi:hypothetical protein